MDAYKCMAMPTVLHVSTRIFWMGKNLILQKGLGLNSLFVYSIHKTRNWLHFEDLSHLLKGLAAKLFTIILSIGSKILAA